MDAPTSSRGCRDARSPRSACARCGRSRAASSIAATLEAVVVEALNFPIPLVEVEPGIFALELFHGPTLAFKDVGARVMARLMASLHRGDEPLTVLAATSGDTGSAVAHAFHGVPHTRVVILYPDGRVSPTQEAQLTMFNGERGERARVRGGRQLRRLPPADAEAFADPELRQRDAADVGQLGQRRPAAAADGLLLPRGRAAAAQAVGPAAEVVVSHAERQLRQPDRRPDGEARRPADRAVRRRDQRRTTSCRRISTTGRFEPRASVQTLANAMDVGHPSNFERMSWLYGGDLDAMRRDIVGVPLHATTTCARRSGGSTRARLPARSAQRDRVPGAGRAGGQDRAGSGRSGRSGVFLATAHPAKFAEIVEPIIGRAGREAGAAGAGARRGRGTSSGSTRRSMRSRRCCVPDRPRIAPDRTAPTCSSSCGGTALQPKRETPPQLVRGFVRDLYRYEIRRLRERYLSGEISQSGVQPRVDRLRRPYPVLALRPREWLEP